MPRTIITISLVLMVAVLSTACRNKKPAVDQQQSAVEPSPTPTITPTPIATPVSTPTPAPTASPWGEPSPRPGSSPMISPTITPSPGGTPGVTGDAPGVPTAIQAASIPAMIIPVTGIKPEQLRDTFTDARSEGRRHDAIDIIAPHNAPVVAAADGTIARFFYSERGGITIYQWVGDGKVVFYYAHLDRYADGLQAGQKVKQGDLLGYVGDTGNAGAGNYHLHFAVWLVSDPKKYWDGININPYPLLRLKR